MMSLLVLNPPPYFEAEYCLFCGRRRVTVARYRMICLVLQVALNNIVVNKVKYAHTNGYPIYKPAKVNSEYNKTILGKAKTEVPRDVRNSKVRKQDKFKKTGLNIRTLASPKVGQDQVSGGVSVLCWNVAPVANVLWKPLAIGLKVKFGNKVQIIGSKIGVMSDQWKVSLFIVIIQNVV